MENQETLIQKCEAVAREWMTSPLYDEKTQQEVKAMMENPDKTQLIDAFYKTLEFGTGGLRGIMGAGTNRMNIYTVGAATQGLSNYLTRISKTAMKSLLLLATTAATIHASSPRQVPTSSRQTASRSISSKTCVQLPKCLSPFVIWAARAELS